MYTFKTSHRTYSCLKERTLRYVYASNFIMLYDFWMLHLYMYVCMYAYVPLPNDYSTT